MTWIALLWGCSGPDPSERVHLSETSTRAAIAACSDYNTRARREAADDFEKYMASGCNSVLAFFASEGPLENAAVNHGVAYIEALADLQQAGEDLEAERRADRARRLRPTLTAEFLMARHLGVFRHLEAWRATRASG